MKKEERADGRESSISPETQPKLNRSLTALRWEWLGGKVEIPLLFMVAFVYAVGKALAAWLK